MRLHDDVEPELDALAAGRLRAGRDHERQLPVRRLEVARRFAFIVHAEQLGEMKPASAPFRRAVELCGGDPARWVHVGDGLDTDVAGAQACGMRAVWINRRGRPAARGLRARTPSCPRCAGLTALVDRLLAE